jgi:hypothetical protein
MENICLKCPNYRSPSYQAVMCTSYPNCGFFNHFSDIYFKDLMDDLKEKNLLDQQNVKAFIHLLRKKLANGVGLESYLLDDLGAGLIVDALFDDKTSLTLDLTDDNVYNNPNIIRETVIHKVSDILKEE